MLKCSSTEDSIQDDGVRTRWVLPSKRGSRQRAWTNTSAVYVSLTVSISPTFRKTMWT